MPHFQTHGGKYCLYGDFDLGSSRCFAGRAPIMCSSEFVCSAQVGSRMRHLTL